MEALRIVAFLGYSGSGKTTTIERLTSALVARGKRVGVIKHLHDYAPRDPAKDTDRFIMCGANPVVGVAQNGLHLFLAGGGLERALTIMGDASPDYVFVEGFSVHPKLTGGDVLCVVCAKNEGEAAELIEKHASRSIVCITGTITNTTQKTEIRGIPILQDTEKLIQLI
ncbi:MAG: molybdopterin-guanine dinucleotide biosynthesis protein MobB [Thermoprotei archaeon]